jgi:hypothetical protein
LAGFDTTVNPAAPTYIEVGSGNPASNNRCKSETICFCSVSGVLREC